MSLLSFLKVSKVVRGTCRLKVSNTLTLSALSTLSKSVESEGDLPAKSVQHFDTFGTFNTFKSDESAKSVGCISSDVSLTCGCAMRHCVPSFRFFSLTLIVLFPLGMATNKLHAILRSKIAIVMMTLSSTDHYLDIEVEGDIKDGKWGMRSKYSVRLYVAGKEVAKSTIKLRLPVLKWEWNADTQL